MTIGLAAAGPGAGAAILDALARLEAVCEGAVGGFVSMAAMAPGGDVVRADIQRGGAQALMTRTLPPGLMDAPLAVLMSSGPDRPEPLAQFTPARRGVGLVTGHRFPNARGLGGAPMGEQALDGLEAGGAPEAVVADLMARNPQADAGLIVLAPDGRVGLANSALVRRHVDLGARVERGEGYAVAVLHNSIRPHAALADLAVELVLRRLRPADADRRTVQIGAGLPVSGSAPRSRIHASEGRAVALELATAFNGEASWSAGLGPDAEIVEGARVIGHARADPFLLVRDARLVSADGQPTLAMPYRPLPA